MVDIVEVKRSHLYVIRNVFNKRTLKSYSAETLSFLIGKPNDYVSKVESFHEECYPVDVLEHIAKALDQKDYLSLISAGEPDDLVKASMKVEWQDNFLHQECFMYTEDGGVEMMYMVSKNMELPFYGAGNDPEVYELTTILETIDVMIRDGYFDEPRLPFETLAYIKDTFTFLVEPNNFEFVLSQYEEHPGDKKLISIESKGFQYYVADAPEQG
ncbi:hypothetical protein ACSBL2_17090 [Pedobacter sp. AW31-3R]|uniref:hypothetical protein n=1 Tax=Pedobacter sp. AW31-3R TaxID=3445781 RepID=UPI003FA18D69